MNFYPQLYSKGSNSRKFCSCPLHIHPRSWIHAPCHISKGVKKKNDWSLKNGILMFNMENVRSDDKAVHTLDKEISILQAAQSKLEEGGHLSDASKDVVRKWQKSDNKVVHKHRKKSRYKQREAAPIPNGDAGVSQQCRLNGYSDGFFDAKEADKSRKKRSRINRDYELENRKLREKVKELSKQCEKNVNDNYVGPDYTNALLKKKYDNLVTYVLKVEAENQQLQRAINPNDSESAVESALDPFKLRIRHLERKVVDQEDVIKRYEDARKHVENDGFEEELFIKLTTTRDIYETAIQGYKDQIKHLMIECSQLKILNEDLTHIKSTVDAESDLERYDNRGVVRRLESLAELVASNADRKSVLDSLRGVISGLSDRPVSVCSFKPDQQYAELQEKYTVAVRTIEELSRKVSESFVEQKSREERQNGSPNFESKKGAGPESGSPSPVNPTPSPKGSDNSAKDSSSELNRSLNEHITTLKENNRVLQEHVGYLEERLAVLMKEMKRKDEILDRISGQLDAKIRDRFAHSPTEAVPEDRSFQMNELRAENDRLAADLSKIKVEKVHLEKSYRSHSYSLEEQVDQLSLKNAKFQKQLDTIIDMYKQTFTSSDDLTNFSWIHNKAEKKDD